MPVGGACVASSGRSSASSGKGTHVSSPYVPHRPKEGWGHGWEVGLGIVTVVLLILAILSLIL